MTDPRVWETVRTPYGEYVETAIRTRDVEKLPPSALPVLGSTIRSWLDKNDMVYPDVGCLSAFPRTTVTFMVCARPVQVRFMPTHLWVSPSACYH